MLLTSEIRHQHRKIKSKHFLFNIEVTVTIIGDNMIIENIGAILNQDLGALIRLFFTIR